MKIKRPFLIAILAVIITACGAKKNVDSNKLYNTTWELEYISGPRIAFNGLYPDKKPKITFDKITEQVTGNNSCNGYSANYKLNNDSIKIGEPGPTTMMFCGEGEKVFLNMMTKINTYSLDADGKLNLMIDEVPMMRFKKAEN
ncbi:META domain-containing protein [Mariniflexile gromovii]|uniref:META domain-containing protein n=1 Tax=Mariniflexile gromovii TaxID=362523 RepID=A0ABS4BWJ9_9FLAO|nr:META domain-containing protein [Mariniflexile gromovii]MBP0904971.1 META domain-containing protein [Mariniflexile gromovii]